MEDVTDPIDAELYWLVRANLLFAALFILIVIYNGRIGSPLLAVTGRWLRWIVVSIAGGTLLHMTGWIDRSPAVLIAAAAIVFALAETLRNWMITGALSHSELPLFPQFRSTGGPDEWPVQPRLLELKQWMRNAGFEFKVAIQARLTEEILLRGSVYQHRTNHTRLQVLFLQQPNGSFIPTLSFMNRLQDGMRVITDNSFIPFGGFYPEDCDVQRCPLIRQPERLYRIHRQRIERLGGLSTALETDPIEDINFMQRQMERVNTDLGFLTPYPRDEETGRLTREGRYRLWREMWTLEYLGRASRYRD